MVQKKLSQLQQRRIANKSANKSIGHGSTAQGLVVCHYGKEVDIETNIETNIHSVIRCNLRQNLPPIAVGDQVYYEINNSNINNQTENNTGIVTKILPRTSLLERSSLTNFNAKHKPRPIAANLDQILIIIAPEPAPQSYLIDQFLIIAESAHLNSILIFNKYDIYQALQNNQNKQSYDDLISIYQKLGYPVLNISANDDQSYAALNRLLANKTSILVGQSGVGKSTITKKLAPDSDILTGAISEKSLLGKHTTTTAKLYHLDNNANLIDAPGIREMGVAHLDRKTIEQAYREFRPYLGNCKFKDCSHEHEPNCALKQALADQIINKVRWSNYKKFVQL